MVVIPDKIVDLLSSMFEDVRDKQFIIGDTLIDIVNATGDKGGTIAYLSGRLGVSASTLYDYYRIAKLWTPEYRAMYQALDWTIYRNADPTDPEDIALLEKCIDEGWNATKFKEQKYPTLQDPGAILGKMVAMGKRLYEQDTLEIEQREEILKAISILQEIMEELELIGVALERA